MDEKYENSAPHDQNPTPTTPQYPYHAPTNPHTLNCPIDHKKLIEPTPRQLLTPLYLNKPSLLVTTYPNHTNYTPHYCQNRFTLLAFSTLNFPESMKRSKQSPLSSTHKSSAGPIQHAFSFLPFPLLSFPLHTNTRSPALSSLQMNLVVAAAFTSLTCSIHSSRRAPKSASLGRGSSGTDGYPRRFVSSVSASFLGLTPVSNSKGEIESSTPPVKGNRLDLTANTAEGNN